MRPRVVIETVMVSGAAASRSSWAALFGYAALVYGSLPWTRDVLVALGQHHAVGLLVTASYFGAAALIVYHVVFDVRLTDRAAFVALVVLGAGVGALVLGLSIPEERMHFLQYGLMAVLARRAVAPYLGPWAHYIAAVVLSALLGLGDELIQGLLPDRHYDTRDVLINAVAAALAMVGYELLHNRLGLRSPPPTAGADPS